MCIIILLEVSIDMSTVPVDYLESSHECVVGL